MPRLQKFFGAKVGSVLKRRGVIIPLSAIMMVMIFAMAALAIDMGYMFVVRTQLQAAADAGALAAGNSLHRSPADVIAVGVDYVTRHEAGGRFIQPAETLVELGVWDAEAETFTPLGGGELGNAVRVTASRTDEALFFARVIGTQQFTTQASAIAMANPKDIVFVVDQSGSMNDDTEPGWATSTVNGTFASAGFPTIGNDLMDVVYQDMGFGAFPGTLEYLGAPLGVPKSSLAYAEMTTDDGPLSVAGTPSKYRIQAGQNESTRRRQAYNWIIENQIARLMPNVTPAPTTANFRYWQKYIDYIMHSRRIRAPKPPAPPKPPKPPSGGGGGGGGGGTPKPPKPPSPPKPPKPPIGQLSPGERVEHIAASRLGVVGLIAANRFGFGPATMFATQAQVYGAGASGPGLPRVGGLNGRYSMNLPPSQDGDRIDRFNNPNRTSFPKANRNLPRGLRNFIGYLTYTQFLMDHGRDLKPDGRTHVESSIESGACPMHSESVAGRTFDFPPREQPMHACRRSIISALDVVEDRNGVIPSRAHRDRVGVVTFDTVDGSIVREGLTSDYSAVMESATTLQAVGDKGVSTATEKGLALAREILKPVSEGGQGREFSTKIAVLLTDGMPNAYDVSDVDVDAAAAGSSGAEFYGGGYYWLDAALMRVGQLEAAKVDTYPVGIGLGTDYDFMDRTARTGGTAGADGQSPRGSGNPAEYEQRLTEIFEKIIKEPTSKLVQ